MIRDDGFRNPHAYLEPPCVLMTSPNYAAGQVVDGRLICGAKTRSGAPCKQRPLAGRDRCRMHGGGTPRGTSLPQTKHGRYSRDLPTRMLATYQEALADDDLLSLREDIALYTAREGELLRRVKASESEAAWLAIRKAWSDYESAVRAKDHQAMAAALTRVG